MRCWHCGKIYENTTTCPQCGVWFFDEDKRTRYDMGIIEEPQTQSSILLKRLTQLADILDSKGFYREANEVDKVTTNNS